MKNLFLLAFILLGSIELAAQDKDDHRDQIKALKIAHFTEGLDLDPGEAEKFWPIYNEYEEDRSSLYRREHADINNLERMTENEASEKIEEYVELEKQEYLLKERFFEQLDQIFSSKEILHLIKIEDEFNEKIVREYWHRQKKSR